MKGLTDLDVTEHVVESASFVEGDNREAKYSGWPRNKNLNISSP